MPSANTVFQWIETIESAISNADKVGYLYKRGEKNVAWKRRWFVLRGGYLDYFESQVYQILSHLHQVPE